MFSDIILLTRELFFISPELTKERCEKQETYQQAPVTASDIQFLDHYDEDKVHLNAKNTVRDSVPGMKNYQCRLYRRSKNLHLRSVSKRSDYIRSTIVGFFFNFQRDKNNCKTKIKLISFFSFSCLFMKQSSPLFKVV